MALWRPRGRFKKDETSGKQGQVRDKLGVAFAEQWEAQAGQSLTFVWNPPRPGSKAYYPTLECPRCGVGGKANQVWDAHSPEFCTRALELRCQLASAAEATLAGSKRARGGTSGGSNKCAACPHCDKFHEGEYWRKGGI